MPSSASHLPLLETAPALNAGYAAQDWSATPLGEPSGWPPLLRNSVGMMLEVQFPMFIAWGPELALLYNAAYLPLIGAKHPLALGHPVKQVWAELWDNVKPLIDRSLAGESSFAADVPRVLLVDGRPERCWFTLSYSPIRDADGTVAGVLCVICETTQRVRLERRQALQLQLVDALEDLSTVGQVTQAASSLLGQHLGATNVFYSDVDDAKNHFEIIEDWAADPSTSLASQSGLLDDFGPEAIDCLRAGTTLIIDDVRSDPRVERFAPAYMALGVGAVLSVPQVRSGALAATLSVYHSGPRQWTAEDVAVAYDVAERTWHAIDRIRSAQTLQRADQRKDEFLAMLAHELRNPLAPIRSASELLPLLAEDPGKVKSIGATIGRQVQHMAGLVDDLLDVSRVTTGLVTLASEWVDIVAVVHDAAEQVKAAFADRHQQFNFDFSHDVIFLMGDHKRLVQIVSNLLMNAAKYSPEGAWIETSAWRDGTAVRIIVRDSGIGIDKEFLPHVFDLFTQSRRSPARSEGGLGIGLSLVKNLVELHGGTIRADSEGLDLGSTFTIWLPGSQADQAPVAGAAASTTGPAVAIAPGQRHLLVVDDNVDAADTMATFLELYGHVVDVVYDGPSALALVEHSHFDACLLDIGLPGMDGRELATLLRQMPGTREAQLIAVSGYGAPSDIQAGITAGFDHYFVKPVNMADLVAMFEPPKDPF